jgi:hypothetical protein
MGALLGEPMKHNWKMDYIYEGVTYKCINGVVDLPVEIQKLNPIKEESEKDEKIFNSEKDELVSMAVELGLGAESTLKRNSIETLKKKIEEA